MELEQSRVLLVTVLGVPWLHVMAVSTARLAKGYLLSTHLSATESHSDR